MFHRVLIANRGEVACRIARTCRRLGIEYVAVYSEPDSHSPHLKEAVRAVKIGPGSPEQSYLNVKRLVDAGIATECDAVHPGYGFLSENPSFARAVAKAGMIFIGPQAETIEAMGDKARAKSLMRDAGVPVIQGTDESSDDPEVIMALASKVGFPALLKPVAGGGGKGMVIVEAADRVKEAARAAVRLSVANFGNGRVLVEQCLRAPRHVEVQIFGDDYGNVVHLFERECSLQRRHQKLVEEAPASGLPDGVRNGLRDAAVRGAQAIGYRNAGTFEFLVSDTGEFYFLEVNTRLQVEHPVTEMVTGVDLVEWQLRVAAGERVPLLQDDLHCSGHAFECRIYAEDPSDGFKPAPGKVVALEWPKSVRVDTGVAAGMAVSPYYDPMVAKVICAGSTRLGAMEKMLAALKGTAVLGLTTNISFLRGLLAHPDVLRGSVDTQFVDRNLAELRPKSDAGQAVACAAAFELPHSTAEASSPWRRADRIGLLDRHALDPSAPFGRITAYDQAEWRESLITQWSGNDVEIDVDGRSYKVSVGSRDKSGIVRGAVDSGHTWTAVREHEAIELQIDGSRFRLVRERGADVEAAAGGNLAVSPMPAVVSAVLVTEGKLVERGETLIVVEAMKMEIVVAAPVKGVVSELRCRAGDRVKANEVIAVITGADVAEIA